MASLYELILLAEKQHRDPQQTYDSLTFEQTKRLLRIKKVLVDEHVWREGGEPRDAGQLDTLWRNLKSVRSTYRSYTEQRARNAIYSYLQSVFALVYKWHKEGSELWNARWCFLLEGQVVPERLDPFVAVISCTVDHCKVHRLTISKWTRALRYFMTHKPPDVPLQEFSRSKRGINDCAAKAARRRRPRGQRAAGGKAKK